MTEDISKPPKQYDYLLKFLLVGDSDVGKQEILSDLDDGSSESPFCGHSAYKTTTILLDGKRVKLQLWDTSGQGRFCTIIRSYSRGAQGVLLVYDITNRWSFDGLDRWLKEVDEHAPGVPKVLVGNRLHLAFNRKVHQRDAQLYANKHSMAFFEVSPLCNFNIHESFCELSRMALHRNGMERLWRSNKVLSLQELCCRAIVARTTVYSIEQLPLPTSVKSHLKSYALTSSSTQWRYAISQKKNSSNSRSRKKRFTSTPTTPGSLTDKDSRTSCVPRNSCTIS
ncbi:ras-related protein Rab-40B isoform X2 [Diorhabda sublineata]|uniref:ras-related protein Rab-40B isoform X2 n=1 Tax=Diorhabda sublineata TaxID=1163346 RepID=UPI0024E17990|nr:ras-related protein Rab-40B isoform X2 [Diorhabda sublineata]